ncbi:MAG TPA: Lsr2 family protein [Streptosporangiaceae bacterium]|nr:Lsr2 family protein [Streptosporangiaceae bacterium]
MAQKVSVTYACDYDKKEIPHGQERTRAFGVDGQKYEIDLCKKHSDKLDEILKRYVSYARKATTRAARRRRRTAAHRQRSAQIRAWAKNRGIPVSDRGRIPSDVINKYETTHH